MQCPTRGGPDIPIDIEAIGAVIRHQSCGAVRERFAAGSRPCGFGKPARAPAADGHIHLQRRIALLQRDQRPQLLRGFTGQCDTAILDRRKREDQRIDLVEILVLRRTPAGRITNHAIVRRCAFRKRGCACAREQQCRSESRQHSSREKVRSEETRLQHNSSA